MKPLLFFILANIFFLCACAQSPTDTVVMGTAVVIKDPRIDLLGKKMAEYNSSLVTQKTSGKGYRLMVISTGDRELAMKVRSQLYQYFPEHKQYMIFQMPNIKIKFGNFTDRGEAEKMRKLIIDMRLVTNNIYLLPETVEIKPEKEKNMQNEK